MWHQLNNMAAYPIIVMVQ